MSSQLKPMMAKIPFTSSFVIKNEYFMDHTLFHECEQNTKDNKQFTNNITTISLIINELYYYQDYRKLQKERHPFLLVSLKLFEVFIISLLIIKKNKEKALKKGSKSADPYFYDISAHYEAKMKRFDKLMQLEIDELNIYFLSLFF